MKKLLSLLKATMSSDMNIFRLNNKKQKNKFLPIILALMFMFYIWMYANILMEQLIPVHQEVVLLTIFVIATSILTLIEGVYKSSSLLFNCKDDDLLLSLPLKKSTVLFIRVFKFYVFELLYNSLFLIPAIVVYIRYMPCDLTFYLVSLLMIILLPVIPVVLSSIIGLIMSNISSKFKHKNIIQIIITMLVLIVVFYIIGFEKDIMAKIASKATNINDFIIKVYYPAGVYINSITKFNLLNLLIFILINIFIFALSVIGFSNIYFKTNSKTKEFSLNKNNKNYKIKTNSIRVSLIKKEISKIISSPVLVTNACFGLVLHLILCIFLAFKFDSIAPSLIMNESQTIEDVYKLIPLLTFILTSFSSFTSSITCSSISLEGKCFTGLKALPVSPLKIIMGKVNAAVLIMLPFILTGNIILFIRFKFSLIQIILIILASFILPILTELIGILFNLFFAKLDATSDAEVVKQSTSTMMATLLGLLLVGVTSLVCFIINNIIGLTLTIFLGLLFYIFALLIVSIFVIREGEELFNKIN